MIKSYEHQIMVRANLDTNVESYTFYEMSEGMDKETTLSINNKIKTSLSVDYRFISATLSFAPKFISDNKYNPLKGNSSYTDLTFRFFPKRFIQTVYYKNVKGFYVENTGDFIPGWQQGKDAYIQFPGLRVQTFGGSTAYALNKNFSVKSIYTQGEWQNKSSGSFTPFLDYDYTIFRNNIDEEKSKETQFNIGANMGYFYNWIIARKVNISPYIALGVGGKFSSSRESLMNGSYGEKEKGQFVTVKFASGLHIGYNSDRFLFGGKLNFTASAYNQQENYTVENSNSFGLLYLGYRFAPPKVVKNSYDKIQKKIPIL